MRNKESISFTLSVSTFIAVLIIWVFMVFASGCSESNAGQNAGKLPYSTIPLEDTAVQSIDYQTLEAAGNESL